MATITIPVDDLTFSVPQIGPKVYITKGPSGWTETFDRRKADTELENLIAPLPIDHIVGMYVEHRIATKTAMDWYTITGYLGRMTHRSPKLVPYPAAIAFWAHVLQALLTGDAN